MVIRRLISRGESSTTPFGCLCLPTGTSHLCAATLRPPSLLLVVLTVLPIYSCPLSRSSCFLLPPSVIPATLTRIPLPIHHRHSFNRAPSLALTGLRISQRTDLTSQLTKTLRLSALRVPKSICSQSPDSYLKTKTPRGLKSDLLPQHSPEVATISTKNLGTAQTNETWMTKHPKDCSLPLPSMTLSNRLNIQSSVH